MEQFVKDGQYNSFIDNLLADVDHQIKNVEKQISGIDHIREELHQVQEIDRM